MRNFWTAIVLLLALAINLSSQTDTAEKPSRPRIGLALSGGGSLGLAHIGVLRYFEEHHIPVDAVAGTSMGALVGGFYATGLNAEQLDEIARTVNFNDIFRTGSNYDDRTVAEKQEWHRSGDATLRFRRNLSLPTGLNTGNRLALFLSRYTQAYSELQSFDELPTPFRCVATDLISSEAFTLDRGSLPLALRSTIALPGVFTPVEWGGHVLVDGGAVDNIPVDVARTMGTDVVIAVSLEAAPVQPKDLNSLTSVLRRVVSVVVLQNERRSKERADMVIAVPLEQFESTDYSRPGEIIEAGYRTAQAMEKQLKQYELPEEQWQAFINARKSRTRTAPDRGRIVAVESLQPAIKHDAIQELNRKLPGVAKEDDLQDTLTGITAATGIPSAYYGWDRVNEGYKITLERRAEGGDVLIRPSLLLQASGGEPTRTSLKIGWLRSPHDSYKSRVLGEATIGFDPGIRFEYYKPVDGQAYFVAPGALYQITHLFSYSTGKPIDFVRDRVAGTMYAGLGTWRFVQWRIGTTAGYDHYRQPIATDVVPSTSTAFANLESRLLVDTQDSGTLPTHGTRIDAAAGYSFRNHSFPYFDASFSKFAPLGKGIGALVLGRGATSFGTNLPFYEQFTGGGFNNLSAYAYQQFHANTMATAGVGAYVALPKVKEFRSVLAIWNEVGRFDLGAKGWETHNSANTGIFLPTPLGPTGIVLSFSEDGRARFRFVFGRF